MKRILLNTKTYIGPLNKGDIDFYSIYKNQLYIISEDKFKYILNYLKIQFPNKAKTGFDISKWLYKKNILNENFLSEISSKILNVPKDFSESDVYYYLSNKKEQRDILFLFLESLRNAYLYGILKSKREDFISIFIDFLKIENQEKDTAAFLRKFYSYLFSTEKYIFLQEIKDFKIPLITLKDKFFFERICKVKDVLSNNEYYKQIFFPKRYNLEFLLEDKLEFNLDNLLKNMLEINSKRLNFERKNFKEIFTVDSDNIFKNCENTNFSFINFNTIILLILFLDENCNIKIDNKIYKNFKSKELLNYFTNKNFSFIVSKLRFLEPCNYANVKISS